MRLHAVHCEGCGAASSAALLPFDAQHAPLPPCLQVRPVLILAALYVASLSLIVLLFSRLPNLEQLAGGGASLWRTVELWTAWWISGGAILTIYFCIPCSPLAPARFCCCAERHGPGSTTSATAGKGTEQLQLSLAVPHSFDQLRAVRRTLELYRQNYAVHVAALLLASHIFLQASPGPAFSLCGRLAVFGCCGWSRVKLAGARLHA